MKLKFGINQAEAFRRGIDAPTSHAMIEVNPADTSEEDRELLADRMISITIHKGHMVDGIVVPFDDKTECTEIEAMTSTYESLMIAVREDQAALLAKEKEEEEEKEIWVEKQTADSITRIKESKRKEAASDLIRRLKEGFSDDD